MKLPFDIESGQFQGLKSRQYTITIEAWLELPWNSRGQICAVDSVVQELGCSGTFIGRQLFENG